MFSTLDYVAGALIALMLIGPLSMAPHYDNHDTRPVGTNASPSESDAHSPPTTPQ